MLCSGRNHHSNTNAELNKLEATEDANTDNTQPLSDQSPTDSTITSSVSITATEELWQPRNKRSRTAMSDITNKKTIQNRVSQFWTAVDNISGSSLEKDATSLVTAAFQSRKGKRVFADITDTISSDQAAEHSQLVQNTQDLFHCLPSSSENRLPLLYFLSHGISSETICSIADVSQQTVRRAQSMSAEDILSRSLFSTRVPVVGTEHFFR